MPEDDLTPEEMALLEDALKSQGSPSQDEKHNAHIFLNKVASSKDTTKTGNLGNEEIGVTPYSQRTYKKLQLLCEDLIDDDIWGDYFKKKSEILTATSLSRGGFLTGLAVVQRREIADVTKHPQQENKGWFRKKNNKEVEVS